MSQAAHPIITIAASESDAVIPELGVTARWLSDATVSGEQARDRCTSHHPPSAPGYVAWSDTVRALRDLLVPKKWKADDSDNYSTVVSPDGRIAIAVAGGDFGTGNAEMTPSTKHPKGRATKEAIKANQLELFPRLNPERIPGVAITWILLVHRQTDGTKDSVWSEISRPDSISESGHIVSWEKRYLLPTIEFDFPPKSSRKDDDQDEGQDYDVPVAAR